MKKVLLTKEHLQEWINKRKQQLENEKRLSSDEEIDSSEIMKRFEQPVELYSRVLEIFFEGVDPIYYHGKSTRWDGSEEKYYVHYIAYPDVSFNELANLTLWDISVMEEVLSGEYCDAWLYDRQQGTPEEKALEIVIRKDYTLYPTVDAYEAERDKIIEKEYIEFYNDFESEEEKEVYRDQLLTETEKHAIYLKTGEVVYILLSIDESLEAV